MNRAEQLRLDAGLTRSELAEKAQVHATTITRLEANEVVGAGRLFAIARALSDSHPDDVKVKPSELQRPAFDPEMDSAA